MRAARFPTEKVPNPTNVTVPLFFNVVVMPPITASIARVAAALDKSADSATWSIKSILFTDTPPG
jgi:hypothetical protein